MLCKKYQLSVPKILENIMNSPQTQLVSSSLSFFSKFKQSVVREVSTDLSNNEENQIDTMQQIKIDIKKSIYQLQIQVKIVLRLEELFSRIDRNLEIITTNQIILCKQQ
ncbi:Hypothetical_protein [Hexamita inflata]|uniref:Hypothetical_protein n=1 Tax=Hexamita inflata TaxID=28002 RepID=A0AA86N540_9EUKA|nr:Hypothetical protein HINF_LOCUS673 [Hexamita inflata]